MVRRTPLVALDVSFSITCIEPQGSAATNYTIAGYTSL